MQFSSVEEVRERAGLRLVLVQGTPSPWGQAAKAMMEYKGLEFAVAGQVPGGDNEALVAWAGVNSGPVVAWQDEPPLNQWADILFLLERLAPQRPLLPEDIAEREQVLGLSHLVCGELGLGWNRRLSLFQPAMQSGDPPPAVRNMALKYRYNEADLAVAEQRQVAALDWLAGRLKAQRARGSTWFVGRDATAVDFYWAAFCNLFDILPQELCPFAPGFRALFERISPAVSAALDPLLLAHRDLTMRRYFKLPMEF
jgi:glutathione S-transferase